MWRRCCAGGPSYDNFPAVSLRAACLLLLVSTAACTTPRPFYDYKTEPDPRKQPFTLGTSDALKINVWRNPDLSTDTVVRPDGTITMPLVGDLLAAGRTPAQLRAEITEKLRTFIKDEAVVTVSIAAINSYKFVVLGNVEKGGVFTPNHYVTVSEAVAMAGGPNRFASPDQMVIIRSDATRGVRRIPIDYTGILEGRHPEQDLALLPGDTVYIP